MPPGTPTMTHILHFSVRDTGIGISPAEMGSLFKLFSQAIPPPPPRSWLIPTARPPPSANHAIISSPEGDGQGPSCNVATTREFV